MIGLNFKICLKYFQIRRVATEAKQNSELLAEYFGLNSCKCDGLIRKHKLTIADHSRLLENLKTLKSFGFDKKEILDNLVILKMHPVTLEQRYLFFKESGFRISSIEHIRKYRHFSNTTVTVLKLLNLIPNSVNVSENYKRYLNPLPEKFDVSDLSDSDNLGYVHLLVMKRYLCWKLETSPDVIEKQLRIHPRIAGRSFSILCENLALLEELGFPPERVLKYGYLLHNYPENTRKNLEELPNIAGTDLKNAMRLYPKLITVPTKNYVSIYGILKEYGIRDDRIRNTLDIFCLSPETLRLRLQEIHSIPELRVLLHHPRILHLIVHHNRTRRRLSFLQQLELKCADFLLLQSPPKKYESLIRDGKDENNVYGLHRFLKSLFGVKKFNKMQWDKHPYNNNVPYVQMEETYNFLRSNNYTNSAILKVMHIILYPKKKIEEAINKMGDNESILDDKLNQSQRLNLMLYYIEREHHFTGNGIWDKAKQTPQN